MEPIYGLGSVRVWAETVYDAGARLVAIEVVDEHRRLVGRASPAELLEVLVTIFERELLGEPGHVPELLLEKLKNAAYTWALDASRRARQLAREIEDEKARTRPEIKWVWEEIKKEEKQLAEAIEEYRRLAIAANAVALAYYAVSGKLPAEELEKLAHAWLGDLPRLREVLEQPPTLEHYLAKTPSQEARAAEG